MSAPRNHHYIPVFYLKRWCNAQGMLTEFSKAHNNKLLSKAKSPRATAYQRDLYSFPQAPPELRQILESKFFNDTDFLAAKALDQLYAGSTKWDPETRSAWSRFVQNFYIRHPDPLSELREYISRTWNRSDRASDENYAKLWRPGLPETFSDYMNSLSSDTAQKLQLRLLHSALDNERIGQRINEMRWEVIDVSNASHQLLTSDWPAELAFPKGALSLPIGPHLLFVAAQSNEILYQVRSVRRNHLVHATNKFVVSRARRFVYARDRSQAAFIARYFSRAAIQPPFWKSLGQHPGRRETAED